MLLPPPKTPHRPWGEGFCRPTEAHCYRAALLSHFSNFFVAVNTMHVIYRGESPSPAVPCSSSTTMKESFSLRAVWLN